MTRYSLDCPTALVIFKITHQDRAGETGTMIQKQGEVVILDHDGQAIIAAEFGEIILCPAKSLHAVEADMAAGAPLLKEYDLVAAMELVRWIPAITVPLTVKWLSLPEIVGVLQDSSSK